MENIERCQWYALRVKPNCERVASLSLGSKGVEHCLPVRRQRRRWSDRYKLVEEPVFPGYVFCQFGLGHRVAVLSSPGVMQIVSFGGTPAPIDPAEMAAVQAISSSGLSMEPWPYLETGQRVYVAEGPLAGLSGIVLDSKTRHSLVVSVTLLRRSVAVDLDAAWVRPIFGPERRTVDAASAWTVENANA